MYIYILKQQHIDIYIYIYIYIYISLFIYLYIHAAVSNGKRKHRRFSSVYRLLIVQTEVSEVIRLQMD